MSKRIHPEDPCVTAYALGELSRTERLEVERAAMLNPELQVALDEAAQLSEMLGGVFGESCLELGADRREAIRRAGRHPDVHELPSARPMRRWGRTVTVLSAAAALVVGGLWVLQEIPVSRIDPDGGEIVATDDDTMMRILLAPVDHSRVVRGPQTNPVPPVRPSAEGVPDITADPQFAAMTTLLREDPDAFFQNVQEAAMSTPMRDLAKLPELVDNNYVFTRDAGRAVVPIVSGRASFPLVERFVRGENRLPPRNMVRIEELINHVVYEDEGDAEADGIRLGAELVRCPWDDSRLLLGVLLRNDSEEILPLDSKLSLDVKPEAVRSYRLVGYAEAGTGVGANVQGGLPPGRSNFVLYELIPAKSEVFMETWVMVRVDLVVGSGETRRGMMVPVTSPPRDWINASASFKTASVLAGYGLLLRDSQHRGEMSGPMLRKLADRALRDVIDGELEQREALQLVIDSGPLLEK